MNQGISISLLRYLLYLYTPLLLLGSLVPIVRGRGEGSSRWIAWCGLVLTMVGDYFLALCASPPASIGFLQGIGGFSVAQLCWILYLKKHTRLNWQLFVGLLFAFTILLLSRVLPVLPSGAHPFLGWAIGGYALLSILSLSLACGRHALGSLWAVGLSLLLFSDLMIVLGQIARVPHLHKLAGAPYLTALLVVALAIAGIGRHRVSLTHIGQRVKQAPLWLALGGMVSMLLFGIAMALFPGGNYKPWMQMLSVLGRVKNRGVTYPASHYLFAAGLALSSLAVAWLYPALIAFVSGVKKRRLLRWAGVLNTAGLLTIAFVPEDLNHFYHNIGCFAAVGGGALTMLLMTFAPVRSRLSTLTRWIWFGWSITLVIIFQALLICHRLRILPYTPWVPSCQKLLILTFVAWMGYLALHLWQRSRRVAVLNSTVATPVLSSSTSLYHISNND